MLHLVLELAGGLGSTLSETPVHEIFSDVYW